MRLVSALLVVFVAGVAGVAIVASPGGGGGGAPAARAREPIALELVRAAQRAHGAAARLSAAPSRGFTRRARRALRRADARFVADGRRLRDAVDEWLGSVAVGPDRVVGALIALRQDASTLRAKVAGLRARGRLRRSRAMVTRALGATATGLRRVVRALAATDPGVASRELAAANAAFARADRAAARANRALGCRRGCSRVLPR